jgi:hypothetical protein
LHVSFTGPYVSGLIEGRAARGQRVVRLPVGKK